MFHDFLLFARVFLLVKVHDCGTNTRGDRTEVGEEEEVEGEEGEGNNGGVAVVFIVSF